MSVIFDPSEVFQLAIRIEENGEKFYRQMADKMTDPKIKELFNFLAQEEIGHRKFYQDVLADMESFEPYESYPGEYFSYLKAYANNVIFNQEAFDEQLNTINDAITALDFAIRAELDSILYYQEIKNIVPKEKQNKVDEIVEEERRHFAKLSDIKNNL